MSKIDLSFYKKLYLQTAGEYCDSLLANCQKVLKNSKDHDALQNIYISAHSLKSQSQVMGYFQTEELSAMIEKTAKKFLEENKAVSEDLMNSLEETAKKIRGLIEKEDKEEIL